MRALAKSLRRKVQDLQRLAVKFGIADRMTLRIGLACLHPLQTLVCTAFGLRL